MTHALGVTLRASLPLSSLSSEVIHQSSSPVVMITMNWYWAVNLAGPCCIQCNISIKLINLENLTSVFTRMSLGGSFNFDFHPWSSLQTNNVHESKGSTIGSISIFSPQTFYISPKTSQFLIPRGRFIKPEHHWCRDHAVFLHITTSQNSNEKTLMVIGNLQAVMMIIGN